jgi:hypothetical protein
VDGADAGETDEFGRGQVAVPYRESSSLSIARGDVRVERSVEVPTDATVSVDGPAVPGGRVGVVATVAGEPIEDATMSVDGASVARTDANGRATVEVPILAGAADVRVERGAVAGATRIGGLWRYWIGLLGTLLVVGVVTWRRGYLAGLSRGRAGPFGSLLATARSLLERLRGDLERTLSTRDAGAASGSAGDDGGTEAEPSVLVEPAADNEVYRAWAALADELGGTHRTPAAVAEGAIEAGLPADAVGELTDLFRAVRYGGADPTEERERRAAAALSRIQEATR